MHADMYANAYALANSHANALALAKKHKLYVRERRTLNYDFIFKNHTYVCANK